MSAERKPTKPQLEAMQRLADVGTLAEKSRGYSCRMARSLIDSGFAKSGYRGINLTEAGVAALAASKGAASVADERKPVDVLVALDAALSAQGKEQIVDRLYHPLRDTRAAVAKLLEDAGAALHDLHAMVDAADRGEVWRVNGATRTRLAALINALAACRGGADRG